MTRADYEHAAAAYEPLSASYERGRNTPPSVGVSRYEGFHARYETDTPDDDAQDAA